MESWCPAWAGRIGPLSSTSVTQMFTVWQLTFPGDGNHDVHKITPRPSQKDLGCVVYPLNNKSLELAPLSNLHTRPRIPSPYSFHSADKPTEPKFPTKTTDLHLPWSLPPDRRWCFLSGSIIMSTCSLFLGIASSQESIPLLQFLSDTRRKRERVYMKSLFQLLKLRFHVQWAILFLTRFLLGCYSVPSPQSRF